MSLCAKCDSATDERWYQEVPLEVCPECGGLWMDYTALEHVLNKAAGDGLVGATQFGVLAEFMNRVESVVTDYPCPTCKQSTLVSHTHDGIEIEWCPTCRGIYLDRNEIQALADWRSSTIAEPDTARPDTAVGFLQLLSQLLR